MFQVNTNCKGTRTFKKIISDLWQQDVHTYRICQEMLSHFYQNCFTYERYRVNG
jgi:hypothetical protein